VGDPEAAEINVIGLFWQLPVSETRFVVMVGGVPKATVVVTGTAAQPPLAGIVYVTV
jgi:hypothetical protein